jgi:hypothetical protein
MSFSNNKKYLTGGAEFICSFLLEKLKEKEVKGRD